MLFRHHDKRVERIFMARKNGALIAAGILAAFAVGLLLGRFVSPNRPGEDPNSQQVVTADPRSQAQRRPFQERRSDDAERPETELAEGFAYRRLRLDTSTETPQACLQFTQQLNDTGDVNYADFVRVKPDAGTAITIDGQSLCITGLGFEKDYRVTLRKGLPNSKGERLERADEVVVAFGDKPAYVGFAGDGVILPRLEADGVGIETVNVEKVEIAVYRVSDRSLARKDIVAGEATGADRYSYVWDREDGKDVGVEVWKGELETPGDTNDATTTVFALGAALGDLRPGAYFLNIKDVSPGADEHRTAEAWRWIVFTDMALTTYSSADGMDVFVRSISSARAMGGVELSLIASNNEILAKAVTNSDGRARFGGAAVNGDHPLTPRMLMAYGPQDDFAALDLERAPLDLSDRDVGGRSAPPKIDAFVYLDRGIYRPGETVHISGLLRNESGRAIEDRPLTVTINRPNGTEAEKRRVEALTVGGFSFDFDVPSSAPRGVWRISVKADGLKNSVGSESFSVEDFVPQRLEVKIEGDEKSPIRPGDVRELDVSSRYLYGAPASALAVEAEARLRLDPNPFPDFAKYRFGPVNGRFDERFLTLPNTTTDAEGKATVAINVDTAPKNYGAPLRADLVVGVVEPGGRVVRESARIPVRPDDNYIGLKLANDEQSFGQGEEVAVDAVLLDWNGQPVEGELEWRLVEEDYWFDWYRENGSWRWRRSFRDVLIAEGRGKSTPEQIAKLINQRIDPGTYRLTVSQAGAKTKSDIRFYVGWRSYASGAETPDQASMTLQTDKVVPGARARLYLNPPYAGEAIIAIATDKVHLVQRMKVEEKGREIIIDTDPSWGAGFYVMATVVTPRDPGTLPVPRRAMAVSYVPFDMSARKLAVTLDEPEVFRPRQKLDLPVSIGGAAPGSNVMLTLSAVDEGILRLTKFSSPDPVDYFYGKKRLGVDIRDDYGRILDANLGAAARFGGDQLGGEGLTVVPTKSVALFSGVVTVGQGGKVTVPIEVPDFNGELRLMAVAWSKDKLGSASEPLTVRDAVPAELALPRFLAPGDQASATLLIDNVDGDAGDYNVSLTGEGPVELSTNEQFTLAKGEKQTKVFSFTTGEVGIGAVKLDVEGPGGFKVLRSYPIQSRTPYFPVTDVRTAALEPGERFEVNKSIIDQFVPGSAEVAVSFSRLRGVEPGPLLDALYRYPYGCTEQLTSSAMPLLFVDVLGGEVGRGPERAVRPRVQDAINKLLNRQSPDGAFGLWRVNDRWASPWLGAYVTDFLYRAKNEGYAVPAEALDRAYDSLASIARVDRWYLASYQTEIAKFSNNNDTRDYLRRRSAAYSLYVLARAGRADLSDLRYFHDTLLAETPSPLARAHIGAALAMMGDRARANSAFTKAVEAVGWQNRGDYYQTNLRDVAGLLALAVEAGQTDKTEAIVEQFVGLMKEPNTMHTQEKAFTLLAAQALLREGGPILLSLDGETLTDLPPAPSFTPTVTSLDNGVTYRNDGDGQIFRSLTVSGSPITAPAAVYQGFTITKRVATRDGRAADLNSVQQNDRFVVVLSGTANDQRLHPAVIADLLPAGFEIETILNPSDAGGRGNNGPYKWIGELTYPRIAEARDDRFVAAVDVRGKQRFTVAYVVRAITPGKFVMPGVVIEDMYRPGVYARTPVAQVAITGAE